MAHIKSIWTGVIDFFSDPLCERNKEKIDGYFKGRGYLATVCFIVLAGHLTGLEYYFNIVNMLLFCSALLLTDSIRPAVTFACTVTFQITRGHVPGYPGYSSYYFDGAKLWILIGLTVIMAACVVRFIIVNRVFAGLNFKRTPLLLSLSLLSLSFMLAGAFAPGWRPGDLLHGFCQAATYCFIFLVFYGSFKKEKGEDALSFYTYLSSMMAIILVVQAIFLYLTGGVIEGGSIIKERIHFGWGIWTTAGIYFATLIPSVFIGVIREKHPVFYFVLATLTLFGAVLTLSRNAILFGGAAYAACVLICCFKGNNKKLFRIVAAAGLVLAMLAAVLMWDKITLVLKDLFDRGLSDNGRFKLWAMGIENFLKAPLFGNGYYSLEVTENVVITTHFLPKMAHNTIVQILSSMGVAGICAYGFYRYKTLIPFLKRPTAAKTVLLISVLVLLGGSLLDNFIFRFYNIFHYSAALAIAFRLYEDEQDEIRVESI